VRRRAILAGVASLAVASLVSPPGRARGRSPYGGRVLFHAPWPLGGIDPHRLDDPAAAFFGESVFDTLYAKDDSGAFAPSLAAADPEVDGATLRVALREGVRFASGAGFDARVASASIARSRSHDGSAWLAEIPPPRVDKKSLVFPMRDARKLVRGLASSLVAVVPPRFTPERPDGTGPFRAEVQSGALLLSRNTLAANGPAFLDVIEVRRATDLVTSLRAFESGTDDIGWLGSFLHEPRQGARSFDAGVLAWAVLRTGRDAGSLDTPGTAQALADGVPHAALAALVVGPLWEQSPATWTGPPSDLLVREDAPWMVEVARAVSVALSSPGHELRCVPLPAADLAPRRITRAFTLMLDLTRPAGPGPLGALLGLATADDPAAAAALARHPPRGDVPPRTATRTMRLGVVAEARLQGGHMPDLVLPSSPWGRGIDWGSALRVPTRAGSSRTGT
jgi:peptide/nickel transport system substrate-binding protein